MYDVPLSACKMGLNAKQAATALKSALNDSNQQVRNAAATALKKI
jgi:hypothetical protein